MEIVSIKIGDLKPYDKNAKKHDKTQIDNVAESIKQFGMVQPIVVDKDNVVIIGHCRLEACKKLKYKEVPCVMADTLTDDQVAKLRLLDNKLNESDWDFELLSDELKQLDLSAFDLDWGIAVDEEFDSKEEMIEAKKSLAEEFIVPPFSVLDASQGYWQDRKANWKKLFDSREGRDEALLGNGLKELAEKYGLNLNGTSEFDPVLCEILIFWYCRQGGVILDPFAGGVVRGAVASFLGNDYYGIDLSDNQIKTNKEQFEKIKFLNDLNNKELITPKWITGDSNNINNLVQRGDFDFMITCPPYADLEKYSDDPADLSNMDYDDFVKVYRSIIQKCYNKMKDNTFACIVVGEVRDKKGIYRNFVGDTIKAFVDAGFKYYNEIILKTAGGTNALRARRIFGTKKKVVKTHQNCFIFIKGDDVMKAHENVMVFVKGDVDKTIASFEIVDDDNLGDVKL